MENPTEALRPERPAMRVARMLSPSTTAGQRSFRTFSHGPEARLRLEERS